MTVVSDIITSAISDLLYVAVGETATAADIATGLRMLNDMIYAWANDSVDVMHADFTLSSLFTFFVPPKTVDGDTLAVAAYTGTWNASTNSPALASSVGTKGVAYKVSVSGTTSLDGLAAWTVGDFLIFDGAVWRKGRNVNQHQQAVIALLAVRLSTAFSVPVPPEVAMTASDGWRSLQSQFVLPTTVTFDSALTRLPSRRFINGDIV